MLPFKSMTPQLAAKVLAAAPAYEGSLSGDWKAVWTLIDELRQICSNQQNEIEELRERAAAPKQQLLDLHSRLRKLEEKIDAIRGSNPAPVEPLAVDKNNEVVF